MSLTTPRASRRAWAGLAVLMLPTILIVMDVSVLHLAVPHMVADLKPTSTQLLWIVDIYGFLIAGSLLTMGTLGDRIGRRKLLLIGAAAFGITSILAAFSTTPEMLIASRALLGIAGATLMPSTLALIRTLFLDPAQRSVAIGVWVSGFSVGGAIGPLVGGLVLQHFWWGAVFLLNVPIMLLLLVLGPWLLPEASDPNAGKLDLASAGLSLAAVLLVIFGIKHLVQDGVGATSLLAIVFGLVLGYFFVRRQRTLDDPLIDLQLFRIPIFNAAIVTYILAVFVSFGVFLFIAQYLQLVVGLSPLQAGIWSVPGAISSIIGSNIAPVFSRRMRPAYVVALGLALAAIGFGFIIPIGVDSLALVVIGWTVLSLGFGLTFTTSTDLVIGSAPPERAGAAAALTETSAELGGALGIAVLGTLGMALYRARVMDTLPADTPPAAVAAANDTLGSVVALVEKLPVANGAALLAAARDAFTHSLQINAIIAAVVMGGLAIMSALVLRNVTLGEGAESEHETPREAPRLPPEAQLRPEQ